MTRGTETGAVTRRTRSILQDLLERRCTELTSAELADDAVIFAPHPDDETLGCGGTIVRKLKHGANISVVYMTDGSASHARLVPAGELASLRQAEARAAANTLGLEPERLYFLGVPDGHLREHLFEIQSQLRQLLEETKPAQIFVPYRHDGQDDHLATRSAALKALSQLGQQTTIYEYPVWFWNHWPWMRQESGMFFYRLRDFWRSLRGSWVLLSDFNRCSSIHAELETKKAALNCHRSQMTRLNGARDWLTLQDVADGDFIDRMLSPVERFYRWRLS